MAPSQPRKMRRRFTSDSKGFSSIVGAVFAALLIISLVSTVFVWSLSQNTLYNNSVAQNNQLNMERMSESLQVGNTTYTPYSNGNVSVYAQIQNTGSSSVEFITAWLYVSNASWDNYNWCKLTNASVQSGSIFTLDVNLTVFGVNSSYTYNFASWLITARGNTVSLRRTIVYAYDIIVAQTTQGIGALMMDFQNFTYYNVVGSYGNYSLNPYPNGASGYYVTNSGGPKGQVAFRVIFTDLDLNQRNIVLGNGSEMFIIYPFPGGAYQCDVWYIVNVDQNGKISNSYTPMTLVFNVPTAVYFASKSRGALSVGGTSTTGIAPVNLALVGQIDGFPFGQNVPFVSIEVAS